jgi:hypothetical protein
MFCEFLSVDFLDALRDHELNAAAFSANGAVSRDEPQPFDNPETTTANIRVLHFVLS